MKQYVFLTGSERYKLVVKRQAENVSDSDRDRGWKLAELSKSYINTTTNQVTKKYELH